MAELKRYGTKYGFLSAASLKMIACLAMFLDHFGLIIYPEMVVFRIAGRLAFPLFAYFIAEGCRYTRNKLKHFMLVFSAGLIYLGFYYLISSEIYPSIFLTFSISILLIYYLDFVKKFASRDKKTWKKAALFVSFLALVALSYIPFSLVVFDYGYLGMLAPVLISLFDFKELKVPEKIRWLDSYPVRLFFLAVICVLLALKNSSWKVCVLGVSFSFQFFNLLSIPLLCLYSGKPGTKKLKYFFYLFYPLHLGIIMLIYMIIEAFK